MTPKLGKKQLADIPQVVVATQTAPTPTVSVAVTSQAPAASNTPVPVNPSPSTNSPGTAKTTQTAGGASTSLPAQVTNPNSSNNLRPSSGALAGVMAVLAILTFVL